jgi:protoheme IX farnesyltransferase
LRLAAAPVASAAVPTARDLLELTKPRITATVLVTTAGGLWLAPGTLAAVPALLTLLGTALMVSSASALNALLEREPDARMHRTRGRPIPSGRVSPQVAAIVAGACAGISLPLLALFVGWLPGALAALALVLYVWVYTPMKQRSTDALLVGAVPGAIPPLIGWTAATGRLDLSGFVLFGLLFVWQLPHFLSIALYLEDDYARGGHRVFPVVRGDPAARRYLVLWAALLLPVSLLVVPMHLAGAAYAAVALLAGAAFLGFAVNGLVRGLGRRWARQVMLASVLYLCVIFAALILDAT